MKRTVFLLTAAVALTASQLVPAESPIPVEKVAPVADLAAESTAQADALSKLLENADDFVDSKKKIGQAAGLLACLAQGIAEHPDHAKVEFFGPDVRDVAIAVSKAKSHADAAAGLEKVRIALEGKSDRKADVEHPWNKLVNMHRMMEEINSRNARLRRTVRRSRKPEEESRDATASAVLAVAMYADTHEVKDDANIPEWQQHSREFQEAMTELAAAIKEKKSRDDLNALSKRANKACAACHASFRAE